MNNGDFPSFLVCFTKGCAPGYTFDIHHDHVRHHGASLRRHRCTACESPPATPQRLRGSGLCCSSCAAIKAGWEIPNVAVISEWGIKFMELITKYYQKLVETFKPQACHLRPHLLVFVHIGMRKILPTLWLSSTQRFLQGGCNVAIPSKML